MPTTQLQQRRKLNNALITKADKMGISVDELTEKVNDLYEKYKDERELYTDYSLAKEVSPKIKEDLSKATKPSQVRAIVNLGVFSDLSPEERIATIAKELNENNPTLNLFMENGVYTMGTMMRPTSVGSLTTSTRPVAANEKKNRNFSAPSQLYVIDENTGVKKMINSEEGYIFNLLPESMRRELNFDMMGEEDDEMFQRSMDEYAYNLGGTGRLSHIESMGKIWNEMEPEKKPEFMDAQNMSLYQRDSGFAKRAQEDKQSMANLLMGNM